MSEIKIDSIITLKGKIKVQTGLHIGAGNDTVEIGGMDNPVIKDPVNGEPYIPGSSLKGKMRSLMEWYLDKVKDTQGNPCSCGEPDCPICRVFGCAISNKETKEKSLSRGPTRITVRDAFLSEKSRTEFSGKQMFEDKSENSINRITAEANPRHLERVVPGILFDFEIAYKVYDLGKGPEEDEGLFNDVVLTGLALLKKDYLGGGGSRGSGKITFEELTKVVSKDGEASESKVELPEV